MPLIRFADSPRDRRRNILHHLFLLWHQKEREFVAPLPQSEERIADMRDRRAEIAAFVPQPRHRVFGRCFPERQLPILRLEDVLLAEG